jgi:16S rRNA (cytosine1402-N4)-methyltransferase
MHEPVMQAETVEWLRPADARRIVDATVGGGGHAEALLRSMRPEGRLLGLDGDPAAVRRSTERLAAFGERFIARHSRFSELGARLMELGWNEVDAVLMDLGVSSFQLDEAERGFSFRLDGPLDMRMDPSRGTRAADLVNRLSERDLAALLRQFGEEPRAGRIARAVVRRRERHPFERTLDLAHCVATAAGGRRGARHPATRTFQALRIAVNRELEELDAGLAAAWAALAPGGRLAVISFHSLEDRAVKMFMRERTRSGAPAGRLLVPRGVTPSEAERRRNPRARSARLRVIEKERA